MREPSSEQSHGKQVNNELIEYEGFSEVLSQVEQTERNLRDQPEQPPSEIESGHALQPQRYVELAAQDEAKSVITDCPEIAELMERLQDQENAKRAKVLSILFPTEAANSEE